MFRQLLVDLLGDLEQPLRQLAFDQLLGVLVDGDRSPGLVPDPLGRRLALGSAPATDRGTTGSNSGQLILDKLVVGGNVAWK